MGRCEEKTEKINIGIIFVYLYILMTFIGQAAIMDPQWMFFQKVHQSSLYALLSIGVISILLNIGRFKVVPYYIWYAILIAFSTFSCLYAVNTTAALKGLYSLFVVFGLAVSISVVIKDKKNIKNLLACFSISGVILFVILVQANLLIVEQRLGESITGNANAFAIVVMFSLICSMWFVMYSNGYKKYMYIVFGVMQYFMLFLSGGRKYILVPLAFLFLLFLLQMDTRKKGKMVVHGVIFMLIVMISFWAMFNIPQLYDAVGNRMEEFINLLSGQGGMQTDINRQNMIKYGWTIFQERPVFGYGIDNYQIMNGSVSFEYVYSHNNFIEMLVNLGLIGFVVYYSFYLLLIYKLWVIKGDATKLRNFFLALMICLFPLEMGAITYNLQFLQVFILLASTFLTLEQNS